MGKFLKILFPVFYIPLGFALMTATAGPFEDGEAAYEREDYATALAILSPLAENGDAKAQNILSLMYLSGRGVAKNELQALSWMRLAADQGNTEAQTLLGHAYFHGWGVLPDDAKSVKWYRAAADQGYADAQYELGAMIENGFGTPQNYVEALKWSILAVAGYPATATESRRLATVNRDRQAENMSPAQIAEAERLAREWKPVGFQPTDEDQFTDAVLVLDRGDYDFAARLMRPLAEKGHAGAQAMFGSMYSIGAGVLLNQTEALKWFRLAAQQGEAGGQYCLGSAYEHGSGVPQDYVRAYAWYSLAASSSDSYADEFAKGRDKVAGKLTSDQIAQAQALAIQCKASGFKNCD